MKFTIKALAAVAACVLLNSCVTISHPIAATTHPVGTKCGEAKSHIILGIWSSKGDENGIDKAAKSAGIKKISHVDSYMKSYLLGLYMEQTIKLYGE